MVCSSTLQLLKVCGRILDINPIRYTKKSPVQSEREILLYVSVLKDGTGFFLYL